MIRQISLMKVKDVLIKSKIVLFSHHYLMINKLVNVSPASKFHIKTDTFFVNVNQIPHALFSKAFNVSFLDKI